MVASMNTLPLRIALLCSTLLGATTAQALPSAPPAAAARRFANGLPDDPAWFPIGVWLQSPHNAASYRELGINLYVGLYGGPTKAQLEALDAAQMRVICAQNEVALAHAGPTIQAWMHGDEPDNAQGRRLQGYAPPIPPWQIVQEYERLHRADPTRPILLNLGQGAAWDGWHGRGERTNHPEDYPEYVKGCDLVSFDIYPVTHSHADVKGRLEFVGRGVQRLRQWSGDRKPVWACVETAHVDNPKVRPTPEQVRTEVWIAIACGARGIVYFAHEFAPRFVEAGLLEHEEIAAGVKRLNAEVLAVAPILNAPLLADAVQVEAPGEIAVRAHRLGDTLHLFAASLRPEPTRATFRVMGKPGRAQVVGEGRSIELAGGSFADDFAGYAVRHYRLGP
jgi:hypothetical protein